MRDRWNHAKSFHENGVLNNTVMLWMQTVQKDTESPKFLVQSIGSAFEYKFLDHVRDASALAKLAKSIENTGLTHKSKFNLPHMLSGMALLHGHLLQTQEGIVIIPALRPEMNKVLKESIRLLDSLIDMLYAQQYLISANSAIDLQQMVAQGLWIHEDPLMQLPHIDAAAIKAMAKRGLSGKPSSLQKLLRLDPEKRKELLLDCLEMKSTEEIETAIQRFPLLEFHATHSVPGADEDDLEAETVVAGAVAGTVAGADPAVPLVQRRANVRCGDTVKITVRLSRLRPEDVQGSEALTVSGKLRRALAKDAKRRAAAVEEAAASKASESADPKADPNSLDTIVKDVAIVKHRSASPREAFTMRFPFPKVERWLVDLTPEPDTVEMYQKANIPLFSIIQRAVFLENEDDAEVTFMFPTPPTVAGTVKFRVKVRSDSYMGLDPEPETFQFKVQPAMSQAEFKARQRNRRSGLPPPTKAELDEILKQEQQKQALEAKAAMEKKKAVEQKKRTASIKVVDENGSDTDDSEDERDVKHAERDAKEEGENEEDEADEADDEEEDLEDRFQYEDEADQAGPAEEVQVHWYYLWNSTFLEFVITIALLGLIGVVVVDILDKKGWWDPYVQPVLDRIAAIFKVWLPRDSMLRNFLGECYRILTFGPREEGIVPVKG
jgi:hypothetical protein